MGRLRQGDGGDDGRGRGTRVAEWEEEGQEGGGGGLIKPGSRH